VSDVPDRASIHRDAGQCLGHVRTEAAFGARAWERLCVRRLPNPFGGCFGGTRPKMLLEDEETWTRWTEWNPLSLATTPHRAPRASPLPLSSQQECDVLGNLGLLNGRWRRPTKLTAFQILAVFLIRFQRC
jgi:hypothetical protein